MGICPNPDPIKRYSKLLSLRYEELDSLGEHASRDVVEQLNKEINDYRTALAKLAK